MKKIVRFVLGLCCLPLLLGACTGSDAPTATAVQTEPAATQPDESGGYPGPIDPGGYPYPIEDNFDEVFEANLTPVAPPAEVSATQGAFSIRLTYAGTNRPVRGQLFLAAGMLPVEGVEDGYIPKLESTGAPSSHSDAQGQLNISLIDPGKYALALMTPLGPILVEAEDTGEAIVFDVSANEVTDLGTVAVQLDPEPLEP